jgi:hypothetical protein
MTKWNLFKKCKNVSTYKKTIIFFFWPRGSLLLGGREKEQREPRERGREGQGHKYPSVGLSMI